jgi:uncharacterized iron-regulated membrane protein
MSAYFSQSRLDHLKARRRAWLKVHLYLGLFAGAVLVVIGLSGSILVFWQEIDTWLHPEWHRVQPQAAYRPLAEIVAAANQALPAGLSAPFAYQPGSADLAYWFFSDSKDGKTDTWNVFVDPYTAKVTGTRIWYHAENPLKHSLMGFMFKLHYALLSGHVGSVMVGILSVLSIVLVLTGLIVWWPLTGKWRQALTIKHHASVERLNHDLHKTFGFYSTPVLVAVFVSGVYFNLPDQFFWLAERFSPVSKPADFKSTPSAGPPLSIDEAFKIIENRYADELLYWFSLPKGENGTFVFTFQQRFGGLFTGRHQVVLDRYSGVTLADLSPSIGGGGQMFVQWQWSLHSGQFLRLPGRLLVLMSGLVCAALFVTGMIRWQQKRRAAKLKRVRESG